MAGLLKQDPKVPLERSTHCGKLVQVGKLPYGKESSN
jgi:hypothetical protein